ncbi:related to yfcA [Lecanosticta acicola]|uniref:Related to yfcA n=1 Tax=Lecanosticta acicola TaxID=111012 RepID=A0AAI8Z8K4_9PEZI|nr:related to yfcA [Lecanosticta acicola]
MAPSRGLATFMKLPVPRYIYPRCRSRAFTTTRPVQSGHNRWSKIKHDKAKVDAGKNRQRSIFSSEIATASRLFGPDPNMNPRLADLITKAKREGFAKASIEAAIARGQGRSSTGASLEGVTVEGILPGNVAVIVECETDNKPRTLADVRLAIKDNGGSSTPTSYLFAKKGRIVFEKKEGVGSDEVLEPALEAGAIDVTEDEDGRVVVWTELGDTRAVGDAVSKALDLQVSSSEFIWDPNEDTKVEVPGEKAAEALATFLDELQEKEGTVQSIAMNIAQGSLSEDAWKDLQGRLNA